MPITNAIDRTQTVSLTGGKVLEYNPRRISAIFVNDSANPCYLSFVAPAAANRGIRLNANGGAYEISLVNPYHGEIYAIMTVGAGVLCITEVSG